MESFAIGREQEVEVARTKTPPDWPDVAKQAVNTDERPLGG